METKKKKERLNYNGCRLLAINVIKSAIRDKDYPFFKSDLYHLYAGVAFGCKPDYRSDEDIIMDIEKGRIEEVLKDMRKSNGGRHSKHRF